MPSLMQPTAVASPRVMQSGEYETGLYDFSDSDCGGVHMPLMTVPEFYDTKLYELDDAVYKRIERVFCRSLGDKGRDFLLDRLNMTVAQISTTSCVDVMSAIRILS